MKKVPVSERTFIRSLEAKKDEITITLTSNPYCVGMYVSLYENDNHSQLSLSHKQFPKWVKKAIKGLTKDGFTIETTELKYTDFLSEQDCIDYDVC